jgi:hypothetical protein
VLALADERHGLEARVDAEGSKDGPDVVTHRLHTDMQLSRDLISRAAMFEQAQDFDLARRQVRMHGRSSILLYVFDLAEDADYVVAALERHTAHLHRDALSVGIQEDAPIVRALRGAHEVAEEELVPAAPILGSEDGSQLPPAHVSHDPLRSGIDPADDPVAIDHVGGHADALHFAFAFLAVPVIGLVVVRSRGVWLANVAGLAAILGLTTLPGFLLTDFYDVAIYGELGGDAWQTVNDRIEGASRRIRHVRYRLRRVPARLSARAPRGMARAAATAVAGGRRRRRRGVRAGRPGGFGLLLWALALAAVTFVLRRLEWPLAAPTGVEETAPPPVP